LVVKANQPTLLDRCQRLAWHRVPVQVAHPRPRPRRVELRTLKAVTVHHFGFRTPPRPVQGTRKTRQLRTRRWRTVTIHAVTSLSFEQASPPGSPTPSAARAIENGLHNLRDTTFAEDASQLRTGTGPHVKATLRNLAIGALSRAGPVNHAAAARHHTRDPARPWPPRDHPPMNPT
jgi:hypothetical protein